MTEAKSNSPTRIPSNLPSELHELFRAAAVARSHSYSPYSLYAVGAALRTQSGEIFAGCNVENSTYGATTCAEQVAVHNAISSQGTLKIGEILVITQSSPPGPPCGICRQVIAEFGKDALIHLTNPQGELRSMKLSEIFSDPFLPDHLAKKS